MKKAIIGVVLALALTCGSAAFAVESPEVTPNNNTPRPHPVSPKTSDVSTLAFAGAGVICLAGTVFCIAKSRNA